MVNEKDLAAEVEELKQAVASLQVQVALLNARPTSMPYYPAPNGPWVSPGMPTAPYRIY